MINIPEIIILDTIKKLLKTIRLDYNNNIADTTKSLLYRLLNGNEVQRYKLFTQAEAVFITTDDNPRHLDVNLFFNAKRAGIPTIHITLPSESERNNAIGLSEGFRETIYDETDGAFIRTFNRRYGAKYNIIITSDNSNEVVLLYHFLRSVLISLNPHFNLSGLQNPKLSGGDLQINSELVPSNIFIRSIGMEFEYDVEAQDLFKGTIWPFDIISVGFEMTIPDL